MRVVLLSIQPRFTKALIGGQKRVEFRKRSFPTDVSAVVIYASSPVRRVVGYFEVTAVRTASPATLWKRFGEVGCISGADFDSYYAGDEVGVAIEVGRVVSLPTPLPLAFVSPTGRPPQSFAYLNQATYESLRSHVVQLVQ